MRHKNLLRRIYSTFPLTESSFPRSAVMPIPGSLQKEPDFAGMALPLYAERPHSLSSQLIGVSQGALPPVPPASPKEPAVRLSALDYILRLLYGELASS